MRLYPRRGRSAVHVCPGRQGGREVQIKDALLNGNLQAARRLVNGGLNGLDRFSEAYRIGDSLLPT